MKCPLVLLPTLKKKMAKLSALTLRSKVAHCALVKKVEERTYYQADIIIIILNITLYITIIIIIAIHILTIILNDSLVLMINTRCKRRRLHSRGRKVAMLEIKARRD